MLCSRGKVQQLEGQGFFGLVAVSRSSSLIGKLFT